MIVDPRSGDLGRDLLHALDPCLFARERLNFDPDPVQASLLRSRGSRELLNCTRQFGKSTTTSAAVVHEAHFVPGSRTIIVSPGQRQSNLLLDSVNKFALAASLPCEPLGGDDPGLKMASGTVLALPASEATTRGFAGCTWLIVDEAARVPDAVYFAARPFLATTGGRVWLLSTPFGQRGFFFREHQSGRYNVTRVPAPACARIRPEFLAEERAVLPDAWFRQEYMCEFISAEGSVFDADNVLAAITEEVKPLCL